MRQFSILIIAIAFLTSCVGRNDSKNEKFKRDIPNGKYGEPDLFYQLAQQKAKQLKIDTLQNGFNSLQIRIWYEYPGNYSDLLVLKETDSLWTATLYGMTVDWNPDSRTVRIIDKKIFSKNPKSGWANFLNKLFALQIEKLPHMREIPELKDNTADGMAYGIEVATIKQYRFYVYSNPDKFQEKYWQAKNMVGILNLIETEFGIPSGIRLKQGAK